MEKNIHQSPYAIEQTEIFDLEGQRSRSAEHSQRFISEIPKTENYQKMENSEEN